MLRLRNINPINYQFGEFSTQSFHLLFLTLKALLLVQVAGILIRIDVGERTNVNRKFASSKCY